MSVSAVCAALVALTVHADVDAEWRLHARKWVDADKVLCGIGETSDDVPAHLGRREEAGKELRAARPSNRDVEAALRGSSRPDRLLASAAIAVIGDASDAQVDGLTRQVQDPDPYARLLAVRALRSASAEQVGKRATALVAALVREQNGAVLLEAIPLLEGMDSSDATPVFGHMFELPDDGLHAYAYAMLERLGRPSLESVERYVEQRGSAPARDALRGSDWLRAANQYVDSYRSYYLGGHNGMDDFGALKSAGERLARRVPRESVLREALFHHDALKRAAALAALSVARSTNGDLVPRLIHLMRHERDPVMRGFAADALRAAPEDVVRKNARGVIEALSDESDVHVVVAESFLAMRLDPEAAVEAIAMLSIRGDNTLRRVLHAQLHNIGGPPAVERAAQMLGRLGKTEAAAELREIEKEREERDRAKRRGD